MRFRGIAVPLILLGLSTPPQVFGAEKGSLPPAVDRQIDFAADIEPIFKGRCQLCHGEQQQMNGLRLDRGEDALRGGYAGPVIVPGNSAESKLVQIVAGIKEGTVMPPVGERLTTEEIGVLRAWIDQGAKWPAGTKQANAADTDSRGAEATHWAFRELQRPEIPRVVKRGWVRNPIDHFILHRLETEGIEPSAEADKNTLIRRVTLDLIGLPPTPQEVSDFLSDEQPGAYERVVDRLLKSPHYGERWAAPWLDLARYSDSDGYEQDWPRPHAWRYRHWVIQALNDDKPFDEFTIEQIAGDLLPNATVEQRVATGFHRNTLKNREGGTNVEQFRFEATIDRANTIGTVWLGLTVGCAQCHDHKYDPITQRDYYQLFAFVNNLDELDIQAPLPGEMGPYLAKLPAYQEKRERLLKEHKILDLQRPWEEKLLEAAAHPGRWTDWDQAYDVFPKYLDGGEAILRKKPSERTREEEDRLTDHFLANYHRVISKELNKELGFEKIRKELFIPGNHPREDPPEWYPWLTRAQAVTERTDPRSTHIHLRGDWKSKGLAVEPGTPSWLPPLTTPTGPTRLELARWLVSDENPLTPRVTVNRLWQGHFGQGIVLTSDNFGTQGEKPTHPQLLDWLAAEFRAGGWSAKTIHKLIVTSATYRQSSRARPELDERDPDNKLLARQIRLRLPAESIRDSALAVSGLLYPRIGGPSIKPPQPESVMDQSASVFKWKESTGRERYRRGLYVHLQRTAPFPQMILFDAPDRYVSVCNRERSNTPLQSLNLLNDPVFVEAAQALAIRILTESQGDLRQRLDYAFRLTLGKPPGEEQLNSLTRYYERQVRILEEEAGSAEKLAPVEIPGVPQIETAAWTGLSSVLMNSDEFITRE